MCGLIVLKRLPMNLSFAWKFLLCPSRQASAVPLCPSAWSGESSHARDMQLISVARGVMSSWLRRPTMAGPMTRSATLTRSRWRTSTATYPMPTRLYHKGKTRGSGGISFHELDREQRTPPTDRHTKKPKNVCTRPASIATYIQENLTPFFLLSPHSFIKSMMWAAFWCSENWVAY